MGPAAGALQLSIALFCSFCHDSVARAEACYCASCLAPHHEECFRTHGRCSAMGCEETQTVRPRLEEPRPVATPRRFGRYGLGVALVALGGLGGAVAARRPVPAPAVVAEKPEEAPSEKDVEDIRKLLDRRLVTDDTAPAPRSASQEKIDVDVEDTDIADVMSTVAASVGKAIFVDPDVKEKVSISLRKVPWRDAVSIMANMCKCEVAPLGSESLILRQASGVTIHFQAANVRTVVQLLGAYSGKSLVVSPSCPDADLTVDLHQVPWEKALASILRTYDVHAEIFGHVIVVMPGPGPEPDLSKLDQPVRWTFQTSERDMNAPVDMTVKDADLRDVCDELGRRVGANIIVDPDVKAKVKISLKQVGWHDALLALAHLTRCDLEQRNGIFLLSQAPNITLQMTDAPAVPWFQLIAAYSGKNIVVAPDVAGTITGDLRGARWLDILHAVARAYGYDVNEDAGQIIRVSMPRSGAAEPPKRPETTPARIDGPLDVEGVKKQLVVTAIAIDPESHNSAIVHVQGVARIYQESDAVRDSNSLKVQGLTVVKIAEGTVTLQLDETEFVVGLKTP